MTCICLELALVMIRKLFCFFHDSLVTLYFQSLSSVQRPESLFTISFFFSKISSVVYSEIFVNILNDLPASLV